VARAPQGRHVQTNALIARTVEIDTTGGPTVSSFGQLDFYATRKWC
jgi:hypothetical protein